jgi:hypothetical protein
MTDPTDDAALQELIDHIDRSSNGPSHLEVDQALRARFPPLLFDPYSNEGTHARTDWSQEELAASWAFGYRATITVEGNRKRLTLTEFSVSPDGNTSPPPIGSVEPAILAAWGRLAERVTSSYAQARLHHVLFAAGDGNSREHAIAAAKAYVAVSHRWSREEDSFKDLRTALRLSRAVGDRASSRSICEEMEDTAECILADSDGSPGRFLKYVRELSDEPDANSNRVTDLLRRSLVAYSDPRLLGNLYQLLLPRVHDSEKSALEANSVQLWIDSAQRQEHGLVKAIHLKAALEIATSLQRSDLVELATRVLQGLTDEDLKMSEIGSSIVLSSEERERMIASILNQESWREALLRFANFGPPTGNVEDNRSVPRSVASQILRSEQFGPYNLPRFAGDSDEAQEEIDLAQLETLNLQFFAPFIAQALLEIPRKFGMPADQELAEFLSEFPLVSDERGLGLARVIIRFWLSDYEGAAFAGAPRIEALARDLALSLDAGIYRIQRDEKPGQFPGLGSLLGTLRDQGMDESWYRMIYTTTCNPAGGWNLRNMLGHGLAEDVGVAGAAVIIQAMLHLAFLGVRIEDESPIEIRGHSSESTEAEAADLDADTEGDEN